MGRLERGQGREVKEIAQGRVRRAGEGLEKFA